MENLASYKWIVFTSVNGLRFFWQALRKSGRDARALGAARIAAIGPATARALEERGLYADLVPPKYVAESVVEALEKTASLKDARVLLPRAAKAREVLPDCLAKAGATVDVVACYETVPEEAPREELLKRILAGDVDCRTFGPSSTVHNFFPLFHETTMP